MPDDQTSERSIKIHQSSGLRLPVVYTAGSLSRSPPAHFFLPARTWIQLGILSLQEKGVPPSAYGKIMDS